MKTKSVIIGAGVHGEVYLSYLKEIGIEVVGFLDDSDEKVGKVIRGIPVLGKINLLETLSETMGVDSVFCPIGNNKVRVRILKKAQELGYETPNFIHSSVIISPDVEIGKGVYILPRTTIMPYAKICDFCMISEGTNLTHHSVLNEGTFLSLGVNFGASIIAEKFAYVGMGATIMTGVKRIGEDCLVGAGAVVIKDVPAGACEAGCDAESI